MKSTEIRQKYLKFFKDKNHALIPSASLLPENDSTLLFVNSGMFPLVPYLLGAKHPAGKRLVNSQKSFRTEDIDEVGDNRHNTFFEMLGNWSLGDYWKSEQLHWWYEFLVDELKLDPKRLYQSVYAGSKDGQIPKDTESIEIVKQIFNKYGVDDEDRIFEYVDKNWWQRGDAIGELGGPDSETFYDTGKEHDTKFGEQCHINCDCGKYIEIGNSVFMQYQKTEHGWKELELKNVDFGGGLERLCMVTQDKPNIFQTDLFNDAILKIEELSGKKYSDDARPFEIIADHLKAATFIMGDDRGVGPSNTDQGYIVRRLIRRAVRFGKTLGIHENHWTEKISNIFINNYNEVYPELEKNKTLIRELLNQEESKFENTLDNGLKQFKKSISNLSSINGLPIEDLKSLNGLPFGKIKGINGVTLKKQLSGKDAFDLYQSYGFPIEMTQELAEENGVDIDMKEFEKELQKHQTISRTASAGKFKGGLADHSVETTKLHTATHLLLEALKRVLGEHVYQKGSNITGERLRLDFPHPEKMTDEQLKRVEDIVNEAIQAKYPVHFEEMPLEKAREIGATGVFDSKYEQMVKVYFVGEEPDYFSKEICGGPHVENTAELGTFKISKEESSSAGIRRIKAILK